MLFFSPENVNKKPAFQILGRVGDILGAGRGHPVILLSTQISTLNDIGSR
jgi:hypothetical protein